MQKVYEDLKQGRDIRNNLIALKQMLKEEGALEEYLSMTEDDELIASFLQNEDAKIRKNAALVLGLLQSQESIEKIWEAYVSESQLFVRGAYLSALQKLNCRAYEKQLKARYQKLLAYEAGEEEQKHVQDEMKELRRLVIQFDGGISRHVFTGYHKPQDFILTTLKNYQDTTSVQIESGAARVIPMGVQVAGGDIREALNIRTFREMLFTLRCDKNLPPRPAVIAGELAKSNMIRILKELHEGEEPFYFRLEIKSTMPLDKKSVFAKKLAAEIEQRTRHFLVNSTENYEVELRFVQNRNGGFYPCMKLYTIPMKRFSYRKYTTASSMHPTLAALLAELASSWLAERARVLDAFCGTGTLLMERIYALPVRSAYAIDTFADAIQGARENAGIAHMNINFVNRSFFEFEHEQKFQEIWADMPVRGKKTKEEQDAFYQAFFVKVQELLQERGRVFLFCNENGIAKKYLRLNPCLHLKQEFCIREKDGAYFFIIEMRECAKQPEDAPQEALEDSDSGKEGTVQEAGKEQEGQQ
ncbi:MAG: methyltransferase [Eubacterium sp.]|jgi:tRNA G10  N-methylase Trm11|nr:methyltransferase [Eubacterium sp.]